MYEGRRGRKHHKRGKPRGPCTRCHVVHQKGKHGFKCKAKGGK